MENVRKTSDRVDVVRCKNCVNCYELAETDPMTPYSGDGDGSFFCLEWDMDLYAPHYSAETFFCADGKRRNDNE